MPGLRRAGEAALRARILGLSEDGGSALLEPAPGEAELAAALGAAAVNRAVRALSADPGLRRVRFELVPRHLEEEVFWSRYFALCDRLRAEAEGGGGRGGPEETPGVVVPSRAAPTGGEGPTPSASALQRLLAALATARTVASLEECSREGVPCTAAGGSGALGNRLRRAVAAGKTAVVRVMSTDNGLTSGSGSNVAWDIFDPTAGGSRGGGKGGEGGGRTGGRAAGSAKRLAQDMGGAPPDGLLAYIAAAMSRMQTMGQMVALWRECVEEVRFCWQELKPIPRVPEESAPDVMLCPLHQQLMLINCCIARRQRRGQEQRKTAAAGGSDAAGMAGDGLPRPGAEKLVEGLRLLVTGAPMWQPVTQEQPVFTEVLARETEELVRKTGSVGAGCQQVLCDMQGFKSANPGCCLADFVRWYSPADWSGPAAGEHGVGDGEKWVPMAEEDIRERLSARMTEEDNMWAALFDRAQPLPAWEQTPLFDAEVVGDSAVEGLADMAPSDLFEQLFAAGLCAHHRVLEEAVDCATEGDRSSPLLATLVETAEYTARLWVPGISQGKLEKICTMYSAFEDLLAASAKDEEGAAPIPPSSGDSRPSDSGWQRVS